MNMDTKEILLVSACLIGLCTRYDGKISKSSACSQSIGNAFWIPVCPEQLGGLPTPREAADIEHGCNGNDVLLAKAKVFTKSGIDVTPHFVHGAEQVLLIAKSQNITTALLKARSPSCGVREPAGVTAALLRQHGITCKEF